MGVRATPTGMRNRNNQINKDKNAISEGQSASADKRNMLLIKDIGNDIHPSIQLEVNFPSNNKDNKMPILDLKVWVEQRGHRNIITYEFYSKDVPSKTVTDSVSAIPWNIKHTVLTQGVLRILLNCSRELPWNILVQQVNEMMARMQYSGYTKKFRYEVAKSAVKAYDTIVAAGANGERPI